MSSNSIIQKVTTRCSTFWHDTPGLCVAASGGSDSTAMLHILHGLRAELGIRRLAVAHVNHGLRGEESDADERFVAGLARSLNIPFFVKRLRGPTLHAPGMEAWARQERYAFFRALQEQEGFPCIATGHTADDQAETVLLRIMRGCGLRGLRGILAKRDDGVVRPVIDLTRRELAAWLGSRGLSFRSDSSNDDRAFARNRVRHDLLPLLEKGEPGSAQKLARAAGLAQEVWALAQPAVGRWTAEFVQQKTGRIVVRKRGLRDAFFAAEALLALFESCGIPADARHIEEILDKSSRSSGEFLLPGGSWRWYALRQTIEFRRGAAQSGKQFSLLLKVPGVTGCGDPDVRFSIEILRTRPVEFPRDNLTVMLDAGSCGDRLVFRPWKESDTFVPLGGTKALKVKSFLEKQKIPAAERSGVGVVEGKGGGIVWIPGVQISQRSALRHGTRAVLKISYQSCPNMV